MRGSVWGPQAGWKNAGGLPLTVAPQDAARRHAEARHGATPGGTGGPDARFALDRVIEPRIDPEIVFGLALAPEAGMTAPAGAPRCRALGCRRSAADVLDEAGERPAARDTTTKHVKAQAVRKLDERAYRQLNPSVQYTSTNRPASRSNLAARAFASSTE